MGILYMSRSQLEMIRDMTQDTIFRMVRNGVEDINWLMDMTDIYRCAIKEIGRTEEEVKEFDEVSNSKLDRKILDAISGMDVEVKADVVDAAVGEVAVKSKRKQKKHVHMPSSCKLCADYKHGCGGLNKDVCAYNKDFASEVV